MRTPNAVLCFLPSLLAATALFGQAPKEAASPRAHVATLELKDADAGPGVAVEFRGAGTREIAPRGGSCEGRLPCGALAGVERLDQDEPAYALQVDTDGDGSLAGEERHMLRSDESVELDILVPAGK